MTKKPYTTELRIKQYDKPTRRNPAEGAVTGEDAIVIIASANSQSISQT